MKVGMQGAEECGEVEEWFNYRLSRAAPETCATFLGSFIADKTSSQFIKGGKWLVWKFEVLNLHIWISCSIIKSNFLHIQLPQIHKRMLYLDCLY